MKEILFVAKIVWGIIHSIVLPETSLPVWIHIIGLEWRLSFLVVATLGSLLVVLIFWPKETAGIIPLEKRQRIEGFLKKIISFLKNWAMGSLGEMARGIESVSNNNRNKKISIGQLFLGWLILFLIIVINIIKSIKNWLKYRNHSLISWLKGLGYFGVIAGAAFPGTLFPFIPVRQAGMAIVFAIGNWQAKVLFIIVELIRLFIEAWLWK